MLFGKPAMAIAASMDSQRPGKTEVHIGLSDSRYGRKMSSGAPSC